MGRVRVRVRVRIGVRVGVRVRVRAGFSGVKALEENLHFITRDTYQDKGQV